MKKRRPNKNDPPLKVCHRCGVCNYNAAKRCTECYEEFVPKKVQDEAYREMVDVMKRMRPDGSTF